MDIEIKRGDIWLVDLEPTKGYEIRKKRPAVIIQNDMGNKFSGITIIAPITSQQLDHLYPIHVLLTREDSGLPKDSKVLLNHIRAVDKQRLIKRIGRVTPQTMPQINEAIKISLGLVDV